MFTTATINAFNSRMDRLLRQQYTPQWKHTNGTLLAFNHKQSEAVQLEDESEQKEIEEMEENGQEQT